MRFVKAFLIPLCIMAVLFFLPTLLTWNAPAVDGQRIYGLPFTFYAWGGECPESILCSYFSIRSLIIDLAIVIGIPLLIGLLYQRVSGQRDH